jgi:2'-hydroxyisoflavone reductase
MPTRRRFLELSAAAAGAFGLSPLIKIPLIGEQPDTYESLRKRDVGRARVPLNILILGGTGFTGPEQVEYAIARGHRVTLFNRGKTRPGVFKGKVAEELIGDLNSDTSALEGKKFDVVIDNPTTLPFWVKNAAKYLAGNTKHYIFISTTSVYADQSQIGINESSPDGADARGARSVSARSTQRAPAIRVVESRELRRLQGARRAGSGDAVSRN